MTDVTTPPTPAVPKKQRKPKAKAPQVIEDITPIEPINDESALYVPDVPVETEEEERFVSESSSGWSLLDMVYSWAAGFATGFITFGAFNAYAAYLEEERIRQFIAEQQSSQKRPPPPLEEQPQP